MFSRIRFGSVSKQSQTSSRISDTSSRRGRSTTITSVDTDGRLHRRWVFLTYSRCSIESKYEFEQGFSDMLQRNQLTMSTYYGCREHHATEGIHYHVLVNLGKQPNWSFKHARAMFAVDNNECDLLHISKLQARQKISQYIENRVKYCEKEKGGDCFGQRPTTYVEKQQELKRIWEEIGSQPDAPANIAKLKKYFPGVIQALQLLHD